MMNHSDSFLINGDILSSKLRSFPLRMPDEIRDILEHKAKENGRSLQWEILSRIEFILSLEEAFAAESLEFSSMTSRVMGLIEDNEQVDKFREENALLSRELSQHKELNAQLLNRLSSDNKSKDLSKAYHYASELTEILKNLALVPPSEK